MLNESADSLASYKLALFDMVATMLHCNI